MTDNRDIRDWMFRFLMFEADADKFRSAGIRLGADESQAESSLMAETLEPFGVDVREEALRMSRLYALIYCFENSVRSLISDRLQELHGDSWWAEKVTDNVRKFAESRQRDAQKNTWLEGQKQNVLGFVEFGQLADIIIANWEDFSDLIPTQHWLKQRFDELEMARHFIAHNRLLQRSEFQRLEMYVSDWNRMVGL